MLWVKLYWVVNWNVKHVFWPILNTPARYKIQFVRLVLYIQPHLVHHCYMFLCVCDFHHHMLLNNRSTRSSCSSKDKTNWRTAIITTIVYFPLWGNGTIDESQKSSNFLYFCILGTSSRIYLRSIIFVAKYLRFQNIPVDK